MQTIPLAPTPTQTVATVVGGQNCQIYVYQTTKGIFFDLNANGSDVVTAVICQDVNPLVCIQYTGFQGSFMFIDTQGNDDPPAAIIGEDTAAGVGVRWQLIYLTADEYALVAASELP